MSKKIRSFLFVPADNEKLIASAAAKDSDAVILDLEDGTHYSRKEVARASIRQSIRTLAEVGKSPAVRINGDLNTAVSDLRACVDVDLQVILLPKVEHARDVQLIASVVAQLELDRGVPHGQIKFLLQIESALALPKLTEIALSDPRIMGMMLGSEDFSLDCGAIPTPETLFVPSLMVLYACRAAKIQPVGFIDSIASLGDVEQFSETLARARNLGFRGAVVVHPKYVPAVNACFTPSQSQIDDAVDVVAAFKDAERKGLGAIKHNDKMIDKPIYIRALAILEESGITS
jgi:citrate lyase subunit beta/citryl-CoA lyase